MPYCVGLTGGIGSGKSAVATALGELGADIVDTDEISHALTTPGGAAMPEIRAQFGREYMAADGSLDRERMRKLVFGDPAAKKKLEAILHPMIRSRTRDAVAGSRAPYVVIVVPLLFETGAYSELVQRVLVVDCDEAEQIRRVIARGTLDAAQVRRVIAAQIPRAERLKRADDIIENNGGLPELRRRVGELHAGYLRSARAASDPPPSGPGNPRR